MEKCTAIDGTFERAEINFGRNKELILSPYKRYLYVHISNLTNGKSVTLGTDELEELTTLKGDIVNVKQRIRKRGKSCI
jgi:hypothetical protein